MTVYVDEAAWPFRGELWCHMVADSLAELTTFAHHLGLRSGYVQLPPKTRFPHFDLNPSMRAKAVERGAVEVTSKAEYMKLAYALQDEYWQTFAPDELAPNVNGKLLTMMYRQWQRQRTVRGIVRRECGS